MALATITLSLSAVSEAKSLKEERAAIKDMAFAADLEKVATTNPNWRLRADAVYFMTDESSIMRILRNDKDARVRAAALYRISDQRLLERFATSTESPLVLRGVATSKLVDRALLERLAKDDPEPKIRAIAQAALPEPFVEAQIVPIPEVSLEEVEYKE